MTSSMATDDVRGAESFVVVLPPRLRRALANGGATLIEDRRVGTKSSRLTLQFLDIEERREQNPRDSHLERVAAARHKLFVDSVVKNFLFGHDDHLLWPSMSELDRVIALRASQIAADDPAASRVLTQAYEALCEEDEVPGLYRLTDSQLNLRTYTPVTPSEMTSQDTSGVTFKSITNLSQKLTVDEILRLPLSTSATEQLKTCMAMTIVDARALHSESIRSGRLPLFVGIHDILNKCPWVTATAVSQHLATEVKRDASCRVRVRSGIFITVLKLPRVYVFHPTSDPDATDKCEDVVRQREKAAHWNVLSSLAVVMSSTGDYSPFTNATLDSKSVDASAPTMEQTNPGLLLSAPKYMIAVVHGPRVTQQFPVTDIAAKSLVTRSVAYVDMQPLAPGTLDVDGMALIRAEVEKCLMQSPQGAKLGDVRSFCRRNAQIASLWRRHFDVENAIKLGLQDLAVLNRDGYRLKS